jgi:hypothetical protein
MDPILENAVRERAREHCEYCRAPQRYYRERFQIDHIIAKQHGGATELDNLALCCIECNLRKGPNLSSIDSETGAIVTLFHPRRDRWSDHFKWRGPMLVGITSTGRATVFLLAVNRGPRVAVRSSLIAEGVFPPAEG